MSYRFNILAHALLSLIGATASGYATLHHVRVRSAGLSDAFCNVSAAFNCDRVVLSRFSEVLSVPLGVLGFAFFFAQLLLQITAYLAPRSRSAVQGILILSAWVAVAASLFLATASIFVVRAYCIACMSVYAAAAVQGVIAWRSRHSVRDSLRTTAVLAGFSTFTAITVAFTMAFVHWRLPIAEFALGGQAFVLSERLVSPVVHDIPILRGDSASSRQDLRRGNDGAQIIVVEFGDFECPGCQMIAAPLEELYASFKEDVLFVFKHYPVDAACNRPISEPTHEFACLMATVAECAANAGRFWEYFSHIYIDGNIVVSRDEGIKSLTGLGMTESDARTCLDDPAVARKIQQDIELGTSLGARGTPTIFINGRKYLGSPDAASLRRGILKFLPLPRSIGVEKFN